MQQCSLSYLLERVVDLEEDRRKKKIFVEEDGKIMRVCSLRALMRWKYTGDVKLLYYRDETVKLTIAQKTKKDTVTYYCSLAGVLIGQE